MDLEEAKLMLAKEANIICAPQTVIKFYGVLLYFFCYTKRVAPDLLHLYVTNEEMFDVLHEAHMDSNYGKEKKMHKRLLPR